MGQPSGIGTVIRILQPTILLHRSRVGQMDLVVGLHQAIDEPVPVFQQASAPVAYRLLATIALLALASLPMADDIGPLAVGAMQDLHNHAITRLAWGLLCVSYTPRK